MQCSEPPFLRELDPLSYDYDLANENPVGKSQERMFLFDEPPELELMVPLPPMPTGQSNFSENVDHIDMRRFFFAQFGY